ncbi:hypothetical protein [Roseibium sp. M-1]
MEFRKELQNKETLPCQDGSPSAIGNARRTALTSRHRQSTEPQSVNNLFGFLTWRVLQAVRSVSQAKAVSDRRPELKSHFASRHATLIQYFETMNFLARTHISISDLFI